MADTADAVVVGGGVVGASAFFHLCARGLRVVLCEQRRPGAGASGASGAFVQLHFCQNEAEARLTLASLPWFQQWDQLVGAGDCGYVEAGYLRLEPEARAADLRQRVAMLRGAGGDSRVVGPDDVARLAPYLRTEGVAVAAWEPAAGYADALGTVRGFLDAGRQRGGTVRCDTRVTGIRTRGGAVRGVTTSAGAIDAPLVVLAAGVGTVPLLHGLGLRLPLALAQTQWLGFRLPVPAPPEMLTVGDGVSLSYFRAYRPGSAEVLVGLGGSARRPLADPDAVVDDVTPELARTAQARLAERLAGAGEARWVGSGVGPISVTPDDLPVIDQPAQLSGLYLFAGDCGSSFKTAPAIGQVLAELALDGGPRSVDVADFGLRRFGAGTEAA